jgi:hypothetical protein
MIDRLELSVPAHFPRNPAFWSKHRPKPASPKLPYETTIDARRSCDLSVHYGHRTHIPAGRRHYKLDFTSTRLLTVDDLISRISSVFALSREQALALKVTRIDFAVDVADIPVQWFKESCRVRHKSKSGTYDTMKSETAKGTTTVSFGGRPDLYRIYNKIAEKRQRGEEILYTGMFTGGPVPVVTRIERQCNGRAVPKDLATLGALIDHGGKCDPFQNLVCTVGAKTIPCTEDWLPQRWLMNLGLACAVQRFGEASVRSRLNRTGNGNNAQRVFSKYSELRIDAGTGISREQLCELYRASTIRQFNRPKTEEDGSITYPQGGRVFKL